MTDSRKLVFFHSPNTRSSGVRILLEELHADHEMRVINMKAGQQRAADYLAINPMGKVPAIMHGDALITEQAAIYQYLADLHPQAGLAPPIGDPLRGPFLRWLAFYGASFEPAVVDRALKREPAPPAMCPYGDYDTMLKTFVTQLSKGEYFLGPQFSAVDVLWGAALKWMLGFKLLPEDPLIIEYSQRVNARPAFVKVARLENELSASLPGA
ncbi:MAG: glutathione S-transferase, C-terminal domain protein [Hydrocarboniphaga sp.]|uniref:glutathione S-transferase family protein n=1 Tax=Hydrocarboniphaga sp. TaxID=2033016 RepID=UPI002616BB9B|nr:glutathione S-transferase [Hydrocarboniphaga sp.]MDB5968441.1 glutathione S-transferase, C-terminal domain protein [Hydrocarboniphaga sp.]